MCQSVEILVGFHLQETKSKTLFERFNQSSTGQAAKKINDGVGKIVQYEAEHSNTNQCCSPQACIPILPEVLQLCLSGGFCTPNFEVRLLSCILTMATGSQPLPHCGTVPHCGTAALHNLCKPLSRHSSTA